MKYKTPFHVEHGVIYDASGKRVMLWGVNYYAPFNHNYYNIEETGKDHYSAIEEDFRHFKLLGIDFIRIHLYDREITDRNGNIVENHSMEVLDYLVDQAEKNGIYLMITPVVWWNTINNQMQQERSYAYWHIGTQEAFGFSNFYSKDSLLWEKEAIRCQERYFEGLFSRRNRFSGRRMDEYANIVAIELINEPQYPLPDMLLKPEEFDRNRSSAFEFSRGEQLRKLGTLWTKFRRGREADIPLFEKFYDFLVRNYAGALWPIVEKYFGKRVLKTQFSTYCGIVPEFLRTSAEKAGVDAWTLGTYLNVNGFDADNTDKADHLALAGQWYERVRKENYRNFGKIVYEFDATGTQNGYPLAALAAAYAKFGVQMAAYFTYTPAAVAAWNPGWIVHFLSLTHTPAKAAAFAAAGEIFRNLRPDDPQEWGKEIWSGKGFRIERSGDFVSYQDKTTLILSNPSDRNVEKRKTLRRIIGHGNNPLVSCDGNGCYFLTRLSEGRWELEVMPDQKYLRDPGRGKVYRGMANRYIDCTKEPPVSLLMNREIRMDFHGFSVTSCRRPDGMTIPLKDHSASLRPGRYLLEVSEYPETKQLP